jgi:polyferredoxin
LKAAGIDGTMSPRCPQRGHAEDRDLRREQAMPFWQRLIITLIAMIAVSFIVGLLWNWLLGFPMPSYLGGMIGGLTALPVWEFLKRIGPQRYRPVAS